jgi:hypothetical protein
MGEEDIFLPLLPSWEKVAESRMRESLGYNFLF